MRSSKSRWFAFNVAAFALCIGLGAAQAAEPSYPTRPVRWIVAFPPGGITDIMTRMLAERLSEKFGQQFIVDNRPGGGGLIAAGLAARAAPDGYTLFTGTISTLAANVSTYRKLPYDPLKDFSAVTLTAVTPYVLVINSTVAARSVSEFVALAKSRPKQLTFATAGLGGGSHLATELFLAMAGIELVHVPYKGAAPAMVALLAGQVQMNFNQPPSTAPHVASGRIRVLAASGARRVAIFPDVPTLAEAGITGYEATSWQGLVVPPGTPRAVIARRHRAVDAVLRSGEMRERLAAQGSEAVPTTPDEFGKFIGDEISKWARVAKRAGIKPE
jgi:tripartite-type tricarboxylate transporter receptor subunit TctC